MKNKTIEEMREFMLKNDCGSEKQIDIFIDGFKQGIKEERDIIIGLINKTFENFFKKIRKDRK